MNTRSQIRNKVSNEMVQYEVNIDFDEAISAWRTNKKSMGNGQYKYICVAEKDGIKCGKVCYKELSYCWNHKKSMGNGQYQYIYA
jgi:hypothetical protein